MHYYATVWCDYLIYGELNLCVVGPTNVWSEMVLFSTNKIPYTCYVTISISNRYTVGKILGATLQTIYPFPKWTH